MNELILTVHGLDIKDQPHIQLTYKNRSIYFYIGSLWTKKSNKDELASSDKIFEVINDYFKTLSENRLELIYNTYVEIVRDIDIGSTSKIISVAIDKSGSKIPDLLRAVNLEEFVFFMTERGVNKPPNMLIDRWDDNSETLTVTRDRTFIKNDYVELVTLVAITKILVPIMGYFGYVHVDNLNRNSYTNALVDVVNSHYALDELPGYVKIVNFSSEVIRTADLKDKSTDSPSVVAMLTYNVAYDDLPVLVANKVLVGKLSSMLLSTNSDDKNAVTILNKACEAIMAKRTTPQSPKGVKPRWSEGEQEAPLDAVAVRRKYTHLDIELHKHFLANHFMVLDMLGIDTSSTEVVKLVTVAVNGCNELLTTTLTDMQELLIDIVLLPVMRPRSTGLEYDSKRTVVVVTFVCLYMWGYKTLAVLFLSLHKPNSSQLFRQLKPASRDTIEKLSALHRFTVKNSKRVGTESSTAIESILYCIAGVQTNIWVPLCGKELLIEVYGQTLPSVMVPDNLVDDIANCYIIAYNLKGNHA